MDWYAIGGALVALLALSLLSVSLLRARREASRFRILDEVARVSDSADELADTLEAICDLLVPDIADFCMIDVISDGRIERAATRVAPAGGERAQEELASREPSTPPLMVAEGEEVSLEPRFIERMGEAELRELAHGPEDLLWLRGLGVRSAITVALRARGRVIGTVTLATAWSRRRYRRHDARFARVLSGRVALALDNAGLFSDLERAQRERAEIAATLQRGLLPPPLPEIPGWAAAAMDRPRSPRRRATRCAPPPGSVATRWSPSPPSTALCSPAPTRRCAPSSPSRFPPMPPSRSASRSPVTCRRCWSTARR